MRRVGSGKRDGWRIRTSLCGSLMVVCGDIILEFVFPSLSSAQGVAADSPGVATNNAPQGGEISPEGQYKEGLAVGPWMYYPSIFVGGTYNSNPNQAANGTNKDSGWNARVAPRMI